MGTRVVSARTANDAGSGIAPVGRSTLAAYGLLLLSIAVPAWWLVGAVLIEFFGRPGEEFSGNLQFLAVFGGPFLVAALLASAQLGRLFRTRYGSKAALVAWSSLALIVGVFVVWWQHFMDLLIAVVARPDDVEGGWRQVGAPTAEAGMTNYYRLDNPLLWLSAAWLVLGAFVLISASLAGKSAPTAA